MSNLSLSTTDVVPPSDDEPTLVEEAPTVDLEEPALAEETLPPVTLASSPTGVAGSRARHELSGLREPSGREEMFPVGASAGAEEETLDLADETLDAPAISSQGADPLVGRELQQGKYQVLALRPAHAPLPGASATLGASYCAIHTDLQRRLTLRYLPLDATVSLGQRDEAMRQFLREVRVLARLDHPSVPRVHDYFCEDDACYVVMDALAERALSDVLAEAAQLDRVPALPPMRIAQLGVELARALGYLHQQRPPLVLGGLRAEDIALPDDGPAQVVSLGVLSLVASASSASLPSILSAPTLPSAGRVTDPPPENEVPTEPDATLPGTPATAAPTVDLVQPPPGPPNPLDDLFSLGLLLRELAGGATVIARVMDRLHRPEEVAQAPDVEDMPPLSLALAAVIEAATQEDASRRFQSAATLENALASAAAIERRIAMRAERASTPLEPDRLATRMEDGQRDLAATSLEMSTLLAQQQELATRQFAALTEPGSESVASICWRCGGRNLPGALLCRVCGVRQPIAAPAGQRRLSRPPRPRPRTTRKLEDDAWAEWGDDEEGRAAPAERGRRILWAFTWVCFGMAILLGSATAVVTYLALH